MQIGNFEKIMVKTAGEELSSVFGTSKYSLKSLKYTNIICLYASWGGQEGGCSDVFAFFISKPILKQYIIRLLQYIHMGIFKRLVWLYLQFVP